MDAARVLPVLLAGGRSTRYGAPKALALVGGETILDRALAALDGATEPGRAVIVANQPAPYEAAGRPIRGDVRPGAGALGGILTAVAWAEDEGRQAAAVLACDMPFVPSGLLARLVRMCEEDGVAVAESTGPRGVEPLCAVYGTGCAEPIRDALDRGERAVISFFGEVPVHRLPLAEVRRYGEPERMFFNVNRPEERQAAERLAQSRPDRGARDTEETE